MGEGGAPQVYALADAVGLRYRALILLATFTSLRRGELAALRPEDIDLDARTVRVTRQLYYHDAGHSFGPPKSRAGVRDVDFPELIVPDLREHLVWVPSRRRSSSPARPARRWHTRTSVNVSGCLLSPLSAWRAFTFTTCGTPETSSRPTRARISGNSWPGWDTTVSGPR